MTNNLWVAKILIWTEISIKNILLQSESTYGFFFGDLRKDHILRLLFYDKKMKRCLAYFQKIYFQL